MSWLDTLLDRGMQAKQAAEPVAAPPAIARPRQPRPEIKTVWFQTRAPRGGDAGAVELGYYSVADGVLTMRDESGKPTGQQHRLGPSDNERAIAGRLAKAGWVK